MSAIINSNLPNELSSKIHALSKEFTNLAHQMLQSQGLSVLLMPMFRNHNQFIGIDQQTIHVVYTTEGVTSTIVSGVERDLRSKGSLTKKQVIEACVRELGYKDIHYFGFPVSLLEQTSEARKSALVQIINQYIQVKIQPLIRLNNLGLSEALRYLQNARARFETKTPEGYADCKTNCRNVLVSAIKALTGQENVREGIKILGKQGLLGEREEELIRAFGEFLAKLYSVASKKGPHPPLTIEEEDAELVLSLTTSILNYIVNKAIKMR